MVGGRWGVSSAGGSSAIAAGAVGTTELADGAVTTIKITDDNVTNAKLADMAANTVKGNDTGSAANPTDISVGANTVLGRVGANIVAAQLVNAQITDATIADAKLASIFVKVLDREVTQQAVNTTTAETTIFTHTIPENIMSTNKILRFTMGFDYLMNSGTPIATLRIKFGATTLFAGNTSAFGSSSVRRPGYITLLVFNQDSAAVQAMSGLYALNNATVPTTGIGDFSDDEMDGGGIGPIGGSATEDTTAVGGKAFVVTVQMDVSNVNVEFRKRGAVLELL